MKLVGFLALALATAASAQASEVDYRCSRGAGSPVLKLRLSRHSAWLSHIKFQNWLSFNPNAENRRYGVDNGSVIRDLTVPTLMVLGQAAAGDVYYLTEDRSTGIVKEDTYHCQK